jgi:hypothetical protein
VHGDRVQLRQVLLNLVRNAFEAMQQGCEGAGRLVVRTSFETPEVITVAVQDNGMGVDEVSMARLFHPFYDRRPAGWAWDWHSAARLSRRTGAGSGPGGIRRGVSRCCSPSQQADAAWSGQTGTRARPCAGHGESREGTGRYGRSAKYA